MTDTYECTHEYMHMNVQYTALYCTECGYMWHIHLDDYITDQNIDLDAQSLARLLALDLYVLADLT
jgi:hypothetical protein